MAKSVAQRKTKGKNRNDPPYLVWLKKFQDTMPFCHDSFMYNRASSLLNTDSKPSASYINFNFFPYNLPVL